MNLILNDIEVRILGSLIEKEITTPDYYPLTLNALTNACNQKSSRNPAVSYEETTVVRGLDGLKEKGLANTIYKADSRVPKYRHSFNDRFDLSKEEVALLCELMLRGPQTLGELRTHVERMHRFENLEEAGEALQGLLELEEPMVIRLQRQAGRKEQRYMHLFSGIPEIQETEQLPAEKATLQVRAENELVAKLQEELSNLRKEFNELRQAFEDFRAQF